MINIMWNITLHYVFNQAPMWRKRNYANVEVGHYEPVTIVTVLPSIK